VWVLSSSSLQIFTVFFATGDLQRRVGPSGASAALQAFEALAGPLGSPVRAAHPAVFDLLTALLPTAVAAPAEIRGTLAAEGMSEMRTDARAELPRLFGALRVCDAVELAM
jgi:hypothetical protein